MTSQSSEPASGASTIARGAGVMLPATVAGNALLLMLDFWLNGYLPLADYGLFGAAKRLAQLAGFAALLGMENAVIRAVARAPDAPSARHAVRNALFSTVLASAALSAAMLAFVDPLAAWLDPSPTARGVLVAAALGLPGAALRLVAVSAAQGWGALGPRAMVMFMAWPVLQVLGILGAAQVLGIGATAAMAGYSLAVWVGAIDALRRLRKLRPDALGGGGEPGEGGLAALVALSWPLWLQGVGMGLYTWSDQVLLAGLKDTAQAGIYGPVATLAPLFGIGLGALNGAFAPLIAQKHAAGDRDGLSQLYRLVTRWAVALAMLPVAIALAAPMTLLSPWPSASPEAAMALRITALAQLVCTAVGSVNYLLIMSGRTVDTLYNAVPAVIVNLAASLWLIPRLGVTGAALANALAMATANLVGLGQVWLRLRIHPFAASLWRPVLAGAVPFTVAWALRAAMGDGRLTLALAGLAGGGGLLAATWALGLDQVDRDFLARIRARFSR